MKWIGQHIYDFAATFRQSVTTNGGLTVGGNTRCEGSLIFDSVTLTALQTSSESFVDNDTSLMTSAAIEDKIAATTSLEIISLSSDHLALGSILNQ